MEEGGSACSLPAASGSTRLPFTLTRDRFQAERFFQLSLCCVSLDPGVAQSLSSQKLAPRGGGQGKEGVQALSLTPLLVRKAQNLAQASWCGARLPSELPVGRQ